MNYSISEFAAATGLSAHTLRYYEKEGLLTAGRNRGGQRFYNETDLIWVEFIKKLKETGMPIKEIKEYASLRAKGRPTLKARYDMLRQHRMHIVAELAAWQTNLKNMDLKIKYYEDELAKEDGAKKSLLKNKK